MEGVNIRLRPCDKSGGDLLKMMIKGGLGGAWASTKVFYSTSSDPQNMASVMKHNTDPCICQYLSAVSPGAYYGLPGTRYSRPISVRIRIISRFVATFVDAVVASLPSSSQLSRDEASEGELHIALGRCSIPVVQLRCLQYPAFIF